MPSPRRAHPVWPLLLLLACGPEVRPDDAADRDSEPVDSDAEETDRGPAEVTVTVTDADGLPRRGVAIVFHDADGAVASTATTDDHGAAHALVAEGGAVTLRDDAGERLVTFLALAPGDAVHLADDPVPSEVFEGTAAVSLAAHPDSDHYTVRSGCGSAEGDDPGAGFEVPYGAPCLHAGRLDVLAVAEQAGAWAGWTARLDVEAGDDAVDVTLPDPWRTDWATPSVSIDDVPEGAWHFLGEIATYRHGQRFVADAPGADVEPGSGVAVAPKVPVDFATETQVSGTLLLTVHYTARSQLLVRGAGAVPEAVAFDGADAPLPPLAATSDDADPARPRLAWTGATALAAAILDVGYVHASGVGTWRFVLPGDATSLRVPALPDAWVDLAPTEGFASRQIHFRAGSVEGVSAATLRLREHDRLRTELLRAGEASGRRTEIGLHLTPLAPL